MPNPSETPAKTRHNVYEIVTEKILAEMEKGRVPWHRPWKTEQPRNLASGKPYRGINIFLTVLQGYASPWWVTFRQAQARGGYVRKGEKGTPVVFWKFDQASSEETGSDGETTAHKKRPPILRYYTVFNVEQCENLPAPGKAAPAPISSAEAVYTGMPNPPALIENGAAAGYAPKEDKVYLPARGKFDSAEAYYATQFHELTHSTGHASRLNRTNFEASFGSEPYGKEELVAEMGSAMLCANVGIEKKVSDSAAYLGHWVEAIRADSRLVVLAAAQAQKAVDYILPVRESGEKGE